MKSMSTARRRFNPRRFALAGAIALVVSAGPAPADEIEDMSRFVGLMGGFFDLMGSMYEAAENPAHSALIQMNTLEDIYKERGEHARIIDVYRQVLTEARNPVVRRIAYLRLADALKETGQSAEAVTVLQQSLQETVKAADAGQ